MIENIVALVSVFLIAFIFSKKPNDSDLKAFFAGYKISLIIDFLYATVQLIILLITKQNINNYLYIFLGMNRDADWETRIAGLCWDPYLLGMFCATGFFLFKSKIVKIWLCILLFFSFSRAGEVALASACLYYYFPTIRKNLNMKNIAVFLGASTVFLIFLLPIVLDKLDFSRGFSKSSSGWRRVEHYICIPDIWDDDNNILRPLFGGAPFYNGARFYFSNVDTMCKRTIRKYDWVIESDIAGIIWGRGIVGLLIHLFINISIAYKSKNRLLATLAVAVFAGGIGYDYDFAIFANMITCFAMNGMKEENTEILGLSNRRKLICKK